MHELEPGVDVPWPQGVHDPRVAKLVFQVPKNPDRTLLPSDVNLTCMYPVEDVYFVLGLAELPDSEANRFAVEQDVADEEEVHS